MPHGRPTSTSLGVFPKQTRAIQLGFLPPAPTLFAGLYKAFQLVSTGGKAGGVGMQEEKGGYTKVNCTLNSVYKNEH